MKIDSRVLDPNQFKDEASFATAISGGSTLSDVVDALHASASATIVCDTTEIDAAVATGQGQTIYNSIHLAGAGAIAALFCENNSSVTISIYAGSSPSGRFLSVIPPYSWKAFPVPDFVTSITIGIPPGSYGLIRVTASSSRERSVGEGPTTTGVPASYSGNLVTAAGTNDNTITIVPPNKMLVITDIFVSSTVATPVRFQIQAGVGGATIFDGYLVQGASFQLSALANVPAIPAGTVLNFRTFADATPPHNVSYTILGQLR